MVLKRIDSPIDAKPGVYGGQPRLARSGFPLIQLAADYRAGTKVPDFLEAYPQIGEEQLSIATVEHCALYSANVRDFARIHRHRLLASRAHCGIVLRHIQAMPVGDQIRYLLLMADGFEQATMQNALVYLGPWLAATQV